MIGTLVVALVWLCLIGEIIIAIKTVSPDLMHSRVRWLFCFEILVLVCIIIFLENTMRIGAIVDSIVRSG